MADIDFLESKALLELDRTCADAACYALDQITPGKFAESIQAARLAVRELARAAREAES